jgi:hypothetical protein
LVCCFALIKVAISLATAMEPATELSKIRLCIFSNREDSYFPGFSYVNKGAVFITIDLGLEVAHKYKKLNNQSPFFFMIFVYSILISNDSRHNFIINRFLL